MPNTIALASLFVSRTELMMAGLNLVPARKELLRTALDNLDSIR